MRDELLAPGLKAWIHIRVGGLKARGPLGLKLTHEFPESIVGEARDARQVLRLDFIRRPAAQARRDRDRVGVETPLNISVLGAARYAAYAENGWQPEDGKVAFAHGVGRALAREGVVTLEESSHFDFWAHK